jgi:hypothetical protein
MHPKYKKYYEKIIELIKTVREDGIMKKYIIVLAVACLMVSACGCTSPFGQQQNTTPTTIVINNTGSGSSGGSSGGTTVNAAQKCPNCSYYPWHRHTRCPECGYGDNDGILNCPNCGAYTFHGSRWTSGYCTNCGYST